jgi:NADH:ubiquinone oxidoreductase subunit E
MDVMPASLDSSESTIKEVIVRHGESEHELVAILHDVQRVFGYLPENALIQVARNLDVPLSKVYGVATFYTLLSVEPMGEHVIRVCENAPCHLLGADSLIDVLQRELGIPMGGTTSCGKFTLKHTSCLGVCGVAPTIMIDDEVYGNLTPDDIPVILDKYR